MKSLKIFLPIAAIALLCSCNSNAGSAPAAQTAESGVQAKETVAAGSIVYVQMDTLVSQYDMFNDLKSELESKVQAIQDDLAKKGRTFDNAVKDFQTKVQKGLLTRTQMEEQQNQLQERQQELQNLGQQKQMEIEDENAVLYRKVMDAIQTYVEKYNTEHNYALILTTTAGNPVLTGSPSLDITAEILTGLNDEYVKSKSQK